MQYCFSKDFLKCSLLLNGMQQQSKHNPLPPLPSPPPYIQTIEVVLSCTSPVIHQNSNSQQHCSVCYYQTCSPLHQPVNLLVQVELAALDYRSSRLVRVLNAATGQRMGFGEGGATEVVSAR